MKCSEYKKELKNIKPGDAILFSGKGILSDLIKFFDDCKYSHIGIVDVDSKTGELIILQMWGNDLLSDSIKGFLISPLSRMMEAYTDYAIVKVDKSDFEKEKALIYLHFLWDKGVLYDTKLLFKIAFFKWTNKNCKWISKFIKPEKQILDQNTLICYELFWEYISQMGIKDFDNEQDGIVTGWTVINKFKKGKIIE